MSIFSLDGDVAKVHWGKRAIQTIHNIFVIFLTPPSSGLLFPRFFEANHKEYVCLILLSIKSKQEKAIKVQLP
jgi:hypothetical protein